MTLHVGPVPVWYATLTHPGELFVLHWVAGPFDRVGVDVIQFQNQYAVVFVDYLTKWPEVFAAATIANLLIVSRHGVPSDRGRAFLSGLQSCGKDKWLLNHNRTTPACYRMLIFVQNCSFIHLPRAKILDSRTFHCLILISERGK